jgi:hypothetical protein
MPKIIPFPGDPGTKKRREMVSYLRYLADAIENGEDEVEAKSVLVILTGEDRHDILWTGHNELSIHEASTTAYKFTLRKGWKSDGANVVPRNGKGT